MKAVPALLGALALSLFAAEALATANPCDYEAAHPNDPDKVLPGLSGSQMDLKKAEAVCREVLETMPRHARTRFHLGRTIYYQGRGKEALPHLQAAADTGYRQAIFVLGYVLTTGDLDIPRDYCKAGELWLQSAALDHPWSGSYLVKEYLNGNFGACGIKLSDEELERLMKLTQDNVVWALSDGEIERVNAMLEAHLARQQ